MKKIIFIIGCFFLMINSTWAVTLNCPDIAAIGEVFSCSVEEEEYLGMKANYKLGNEFSYVDAKSDSSWKNYYFGSQGFSVGNVNENSKFMMNFDLKVTEQALINQDYLIELADIEVVNSQYEYVKLDNVSSKIRIVSNDNTLKVLGINNGVLTPSFSGDVTSYEASVYSDKVVINAVLNDDSAILAGDVGEKTLDYGVNNFVISVTSARGEVRNYYLYITRKSEDATIKESSDFTLKSLKLSHGKIDFDKNKFLYSVNVDYDVESIVVEAVANSSKANVRIEKSEKLEVGTNNVVIVVTAEDGTVGRYVIAVNRGEKLSDDATIRELRIEGYELDFYSDVYDYELEIEKEEKLDIEVILNDSKAEYEISGNNNLKNNSVITIKVVAKDGSYKNYKINIIKQGESNSDSIANGISYIVLIGLISLAIGVIIVKIVSNINNREEG